MITIFDFFTQYIFEPPIEAHAELPFVEDAAEFVEQLIPDLSGDPMTWGPNFINWNLQNYVRILDNVFGYHNYDADTELQIGSNFFIAEAVYKYSFNGQTTDYTGIIYGYNATGQTQPFTIFNGPHFRVDVVSETVPFAVSSSYSLTGSNQGPRITGSGTAYPLLIVDEDFTRSTGTAVFGNSAGIPTYNGYTVPSISTNTARLKSVGVTSIPDVLNTYPDASFIKPGTYTYDSYKNQVINNFNDSHPDATQNPEDFPSWQEVLDDVHPEDATEPTESPGNGSCNIDYDEILSEKELESILNQETYYLAEVETGVAALTLQPAPEVFLPEKIVEVGSGMFSLGFSTLSDVGLLVPFVSVAVFMFFISTFRR